MSLIHIFNGDSSADSFRSVFRNEFKSLIWREMLCEGPCIYEFGSPAFWKIRSDYFNIRYEVSASHYEDKTQSSWSRFDPFEYDEIVLWFEYDLFCRVNFFCLLSYLSQINFQGTISTVNIVKHQGNGRFVGLGELDPSSYPEILNSRIQLTPLQIDFADQYWKIYCSDDHRQLSVLITQGQSLFPFLKENLASHFKRFPAREYGLNGIELFIISTIGSCNPSHSALLRKMFKQFSKLGYGDTQYEKIIESLKGYHQLENDRYFLNSAGENLLANKEKCLRKHQLYGQCSAGDFILVENKLKRSVST